MKNGLSMISLHHGCISEFSKKLSAFASEGKWVLLTGIRNLENDAYLSEAVKTIRNIFLLSKSISPTFRLFIIFECPLGLTYEPINLSDPLSPLTYLFGICHKVFFNPSPSIKKTLSRFF